MANGKSSRRELMTTAAGVAAAAIVPASARADEPASAKSVSDGKLRQSVCKWCFRDMSVEQLATHARRIGLVGIDLLGPGDFDTLKQHGLICTMTTSHGIADGLNRKEHHEACLKAIRDAIDATAAAGFPNVICFSGNRRGMSDDEGLENCAIALKQIVGHAEQKKVTIHMELLNSKRNHADYMCDRTHWGAELVKRVGSERFKLLYDIYHMQVQEGDVIATIRENKDYIGHYHTAGVPGRHELDESQELFYPAIARAIAETGFTGIFAHEFIPQRDPIASLESAAKLCVV